MQILGLSPRAIEAGRRFFAEHPTIEITVLREADMRTPLVAFDSGVCAKCGYTWHADRLFQDTLAEGLRETGEEMPRGQLPADFVKAIRITHAWDQASRSVYCGGELRIGALAPA